MQVVHNLNMKDKALEYYDRGEKVFPFFSKILVNKGTIFLERGEVDKALPLFYRAITADRRCSAAYGNLGFLYMKEREYGKAKKNLKRAVRLEPKKSVYLKWLGYLYMKTGQDVKLQRSFSVKNNGPFRIVIHCAIRQTALDLRILNVFKAFL